MGLIKAAFGAAGGIMAEQWKEYFYCEAIPLMMAMCRDDAGKKSRRVFCCRSVPAPGGCGLLFQRSSGR